MTTTLPPGSYIKFRYKGDFDYAEIGADGQSYTIIPREAIPLGASVHKCVWKKNAWKNDVLEERGKPETITTVDTRFQAAYAAFRKLSVPDLFKVMDKIQNSTTLVSADDPIGKWLGPLNFRHQQYRDGLVAWHEGRL